MLLLYEDSFEGFLSALFEAFRIKNAELLNEREYTGVSLYETKLVLNDAIKNARIMAGMEKLSPELPKTVYFAWLSELPGIDGDILKTLKIGFAAKKDPLGMMYEDCVKSVEGARFKVWGEAHRYMGFVRFREAGSFIFVADIEPKHFILPVIAEHFHKRYRSLRFVIRDLKRRLAVISEEHGWHIGRLPDDIAELPEGGIYEKLWKGYFDIIAVESRKNPELQKKFVPFYYRKHLIEFSDKL